MSVDARSSVPTSVLLTGATGVLGAHVLKDLLERRPDTQVRCLVRATGVEEGRARIARFLRVYDPEGRLDADFQRRVIPVPGDVARDGLGLSASDHAAIVEETDAVIHSAASTNLLQSFERMVPINVEGARRVAELAVQTRGRRLCQVSTFTVMGDRAFDPGTRFREEDFDLGQGFADMPYQRSKFLAEAWLRREGPSGLDWVIVRPGQIFGESQGGLYPRGQTNVGGLFYDILRTIVETRVAIDTPCPFDVTPVDYVSRGILELGLGDAPSGSTFHLANPGAGAYTSFVNCVRALGYPIVGVSVDEYRRRVLDGELRCVDPAPGSRADATTPYRSPTVHAFAFWFRRPGFDFRQGASVDCEQARTRLEARGVTCPPPDERLIGTYVERCVAEGYLPPPPRASERRTAAAQGPRARAAASTWLPTP